MLEQEAINKYLNMIANDYNGELAKVFQEKYINKDKEIERLNNIINDIDTYIHLWKLDNINEKTMLILNDILLIKNGMSDEVIRLKGSD